MDKKELDKLKESVKTFKKVSDSSWSGDDRMVVESAIYLQLKRIADKLEKGVKSYKE